MYRLWMGRRKKSKPHPLDGLVNFKSGDLSMGDEIIYKRLSDGVTSFGIIQYFEKGKSKGCVTVIDLILSNFQTVLIEDIIREPKAKLVHSLKAKAANRGRR